MPLDVYNVPKLNDISRRVYAFIHTYTGESFFFGNENLATMFSVSEKAIQRAVAELSDLGYIQATYDSTSGKGTTRYVIDQKARVALDKSVQTPQTKVSRAFEADHQTELSGRNEAKMKLPKDNIKDNNIKENFFEKTSKQNRPLKRSSSFGGYSVPQNFPDKKVKQGFDARSVV
jgi:DNA-binding transcriptional MocR family regulator